MKTMRQLIGMTCTACLIYGLPMLSHATTVTLGDGSKYEIYLESHIGNTWTYSVREDSGKSLSHWNVGIPSCIEHITDHSPTQRYDTTDGSTGFEGIKWDVEESFTSGTFSFTLDADYPETTVQAQAKAGKKGNERTGEVIGPECDTFSPPNSVEQPCDFVYGVHDEKLNDSQLFRVDPITLIFEPLGSPCMACDIEAIDISVDPLTFEEKLYAASSDDTINPGFLYQADIFTGELTDIGSLCVTEVDGISINPVDGSLWGWAQDEGLFQVLKGSNGELDVTTCEVIVETVGEYEDLTWDNTGTTIYAVQNVNNIGDKGSDANAPHALLAYNVVNGSLDTVCEQELAGKEIEALEVLTNGELLLGYDEGRNKPMVAVLNPSQCNITLELELANYLTRETPYKDIEGLAVCPPTVPNTPLSVPASVPENNDDNSSSNDSNDGNESTDSQTGTDNSNSIQISLADDRGSTYEFTLVSHVPDTKEWTYRVEKLTAPAGQKDYKDLSHFSLGLGNGCSFANNGGGEFGKDGSSNNFLGLKWNISGGTVTFRLNGDYEVGSIPVLAKSNTNYNTGNMTGPLCSGEVGGFSNDSNDSSGTLGGGSNKGGGPKKP